MESKQPLYPKVIDSNPELHSPFLSSSSTSSSLYPSLDSNTPHPPPPSSGPSLYPSLDMRELAENLFPDSDTDDHNEDARTKGPVSSAAGEDVLPLPPPVEEKLVSIPGAILHLIDDHHSVELGAGDFSVVHLRQGENTVAVLARIGASLVQWPLARDEAVVKLDDSHYFFSLHVPPSSVDHEHEDADDGDTADASSNLVNYGLTFASKGQEKLLKELDAVLENYSSFSVKKVEVKEEIVGAAAKEVVDGSVTKEVTPAEVLGPKKEMMERRSAAYWTTLAPNVEDYSHSMAKLVAMGSGQLIKGIIWTGDVTADRLKWGEDLLKKRITPSSKPMEVSKRVMRRMRRIRRITKMTDNVANGILSGVIKVSGFFTSSIANSAIGKKFFSILPGEVILASLDGFVKVFDAAEVAGKSVLQTSSVVTTSLVSHRYGDQAGEVTHESLHAAGHFMDTAWAVMKIRRALNPKTAMKSKALAKTTAMAAADDLRKDKQDKKDKKDKTGKQGKQ